MPKVSIIVTCYNIAGYLQACLDGIVGQTLCDIEIIIVDDGSTDETPALIKAYAQKDDRIKTVLFDANTPGGVASAANAGLEIATGDYIGFADGDDIYNPQMFERLYDEAVSANADLAMCNYLLLDDITGDVAPPADHDRWQTITAPQVITLDADATKTALKFIAVPWRKLYRGDLIRDNALRFPVGDFFYEDNPFHWFSLICAQRLVMVPEVLCQHRVARLGQTMATVDERLFRIFQHHDIIRNWLVARDLAETYDIALLDWVASQLGWISRSTPPDLYRALFDVLRPIVGQYDAAQIEAMFRATPKGQRSRALMAALKADAYPDFVTALEARGTSQSLIRAGLYHLRENGMASTARITRNVLRDRFGPMLPSRLTAGRGKISNDDVYVAMISLQHRMQRMEDTLARIEARIETGQAAGDGDADKDTD